MSQQKSSFKDGKPPEKSTGGTAAIDAAREQTRKQIEAQLSDLHKNFRVLDYQLLWTMGKNVPLRGGGNPQTDGETITVPNNVTHVDHPAYKTLVMRAWVGHEAAHIKYGSFPLRKYLLQRGAKKFKLRYDPETGKGSPKMHFLSYIFNLIEDVRIEHLMGDEFKGIGSWLKFHNELSLFARPLKHEDIKVGGRTIRSIDSTTYDPSQRDANYFMEELLQLAIIGRTREDVEADHQTLLASIMERIEEYKEIDVPFDEEGNLRETARKTRRAGKMFVEIIELIESRYPLSQAQRAAEELKGGTGGQQYDDQIDDNETVSPRNPMNNSREQPKLDKEADEILEGKRAGQKTDDVTRCPVCGDVIGKGGKPAGGA
jgi:hypothetical protein